MRLTVLFVLLAVLTTGCVQESLDLTGQWAGEATLTVDGEQNKFPLQLEFIHTEQNLAGSMIWDGHRREITAGTSEGPKLRFESVAEQDTILFNGLFRNDTIEGRFNITLKIDPEPFPGRFSIARQDYDEATKPKESQVEREARAQCVERTARRLAYLEKSIDEIREKQRALSRGETQTRGEGHQEYLENFQERQLEELGDEYEILRRETCDGGM